MREILFRGKRIDNGEWVYGNLNYGTIEIKSIKDSYYISDFDVNPWDKKFYPVIPESVGQYTGLTDKNGKKIFEGDICRMKADRLKGYGAIIFMGSAFVLCDKTHKKTRYYPLYPDGQFTVVGNIHDNPELLEVEE